MPKKILTNIEFLGQGALWRRLKIIGLWADWPVNNLGVPMPAFEVIFRNIITALSILDFKLSGNKCSEMVPAL